MLTKDLLRVSRAGGGYHPQFADRTHRPLSARVLGTYQGHISKPRSKLQTALADLEADVPDFKLVRGFAKLLEREATFEPRAPVLPERARKVAFEEAEAVGVACDADRETALMHAGERLDATSEDIERSLYADLEERQLLVSFDSRWTPDELVAQYNLSLAQTALFDATELRVRSSDPKALVSAVKRLRLMYEIHKTDAGREVIVTGPDALFRATRRYGTRFARLLRTVVKADEWHLTASIDDYGTERDLVLSDSAPLHPPGTDPVSEVSFDSEVEREFATRFDALGLDWNLVREPEPLEAGSSVMIPDFAFEYQHANFRTFFEIMGFWTPEYVEKKLSQLDTVDDELLVAVDESLGVGEEIATRDHRAIPYSGRIRVKDVRDVLRRYEAELVAESAASLPDEIVPETAVISLADLAASHGVSEDAIAAAMFPEHERVGRTLIRPTVLDELAEEVEDGMVFSEVETVLADFGIEDASTVLSKLGYSVEWDGLSGGTIKKQ